MPVASCRVDVVAAAAPSGIQGLDASWIEKTPANRDYLDAILTRFPQAKILLTLRDPRAIMAAQIALVFVLLVGAAWFSGSLRYFARAHFLIAEDSPARNPQNPPAKYRDRQG